ncbi:hypothetical protein SUDANB19_05834 [Streptomyces sp. enrichment culture]
MRRFHDGAPARAVVSPHRAEPAPASEPGTASGTPACPDARNAAPPDTVRAPGDRATRPEEPHMMAHPETLRELLTRYEALRSRPGRGRELDDVSYTLCVSTATRDIRDALRAARAHVAGSQAA